jgi:RimJ/RimL family protein N-acetyltransferase
MKKDIVLENENIILKPLCEVSENISDQHVVDTANDYDIAKYVGHEFPNPYTIESSKSFKEYAAFAWEKETELVFAIFRKIDNEYIGNIGVKLNKSDNIIKNLGYWLGKKYAGNGYMSQAVKLVNNFCFLELKVRKIEAYVFEGNIASEKVLENNGYKKEGVRRKKHMLRDGTVLDDTCYGLLKEEHPKSI